MITCKRCKKIITKVEDVRNCSICSGHAASIPSHHDDSDYLTPAILGYMIGSGVSQDDNYSPSFSGAGGESGGAGASSSWDSPSESSSPDMSNDTSSSDSSSSDSSSSSSE